MKNRDRDPDHRRRREAGESGDTPDGRKVADALYGGKPDKDRTRSTGTSALEEEEEQTDTSVSPEPTLFSDEENDMPHPSKRKANRHERQIVREAEAKGLEAERAYASNGKSLGEVKACDVLVRGSDTGVMDRLRIQAKRRATVASYLEPPEGTDCVVVREDRGENLAIVPLDVLFRLLSQRSEPPV